jgi:predicted acetyltransferase
MAHLLEPSDAWREAFLELAREYEAAGEPRYALALGDFDAFLERLRARRAGDGLAETEVPVVELWLEQDGRLIGCVRIRLGLNAELEREGGNVGYDIRPSLRGRGHGTELLRLALLRARALGLTRIRITCDDDNLGSIRVIERNGGMLCGTDTSSDSGKLIRQYWIE